MGGEAGCAEAVNASRLAAPPDDTTTRRRTNAANSFASDPGRGRDRFGCYGLRVRRPSGSGSGFPGDHLRAGCLELDLRGLTFECEKPILVRYKQWNIPGQKVDLIVAGVVLVEIKAVPKLRPVHRAQVVSYLKTLDLKVGLLMNFKAAVLKDGFQRVVNSC